MPLRESIVLMGCYCHFNRENTVCRQYFEAKWIFIFSQVGHKNCRVRYLKIWIFISYPMLRYLSWKTLHYLSTILVFTLSAPVIIFTYFMSHCPWHSLIHYQIPVMLLIKPNILCYFWPKAGGGRSFNFPAHPIWQHGIMRKGLVFTNI